MMSQTTLLVVKDKNQKAIAQAVQALNAAGLRVVRSFDLQVARSVHVECACPHHGKTQCSCQMVVLLVYEDEKPPLTLVAHGHDGQTHFALADSPSQPPDARLVAELLKMLSTPAYEGKITTP